MPPLDLYARVRVPMRKLHTRSRVQRAPGFPCALAFRGGRKFKQSSGAFQPRERGRIPSRCLTVESDRLAACIAEDEIDRMRGNLPKLSLVTEGAFEHGQSARYGHDV